MDEVQGVSASLPPFLSKTYEMVDDSLTDSIVSWSANNKSFIVWNPPEFARDLLPKYFKHNNFSSFIRQLNTYGFRKIDPEQWEFANDDFVRGQPQLMKNIHRRKPVHSHSVQNVPVQGQGNSSLSEAERKSMKDEIERLNHEKKRLAVELQRHEQERQGMELQMQFLKDRLQHMQRQQQTIASFVARVLQKPELASNPVPQFELHERKRRLPRVDWSYDEVSIESGQMGSWQSVTRGSMETGKLMQLDSFLTFWEGAILDVGQTQLQSSLNLELDESMSCAESPASSCMQLNVHNQPKSPTIDVNSEPAAPVTPDTAVAAASEPAATVDPESAGSVASEPAAIITPESDASKEQTSKISASGVNDLFWEQFLTENPGSMDSQEVQLEKEDSDGRRNESMPGDNGKLWWNMRNVNNLTEQMGHLTPVEKT